MIPSIQHTSTYTLYQYQDWKGRFDYEKYKKLQISGNRKKLHMV